MFINSNVAVNFTVAVSISVSVSDCPSVRSIVTVIVNGVVSVSVSQVSML